MNVLNNLQASLRCGIARGKIERKDGVTTDLQSVLDVRKQNKKWQGMNASEKRKRRR